MFFLFIHLAPRRGFSIIPAELIMDDAVVASDALGKLPLPSVSVVSPRVASQELVVKSLNLLLRPHCMLLVSLPD